MLDIAREGARYPARPKVALGPEGRGWLARCEAEYQRALGDNAPQNWEKVLAEFGPGYVYETARTQWRLAEASPRPGGGRRRRRLAVRRRRPRKGSARCPLRAALDDLRRRARLADPGGTGAATGTTGAA